MYRNTKNRSFSKISFSDYEDDKYNQIKEEISDHDDEYILNVNENEFISYLSSKYEIEHLRIIEDSEEILEPKPIKEDISPDPYASPIYGCCRSGYKFTVTYNYVGNDELFYVQPSSYIISSYDISVDSYRNIVSIVIQIFEENAEVFEREKKSAYNSAFCNINNINKNINSYNTLLREKIQNIFKREKESRRSKTNFFASIKVKRSNDSSKTYVVPVIEKKKIFKPKVSSLSKQYSYEPTLDNSTYEDIIKEINIAGSCMEKKPSLYIGKDEEGVRDVIVTMLERQFEGVTATGETFNHSGKTDILLKNSEDSSNVFIAECKFWHGSKHYVEAISQLFDRYLTWRDTKTALILFVKDNGFSSIMEKIDTATKSHKYFVRKEGKHNSTSLSYVFQMPTDNEKEVFLEVIAFNFDKP